MSTETKWTKGPWSILGKRSGWRAEPKGAGINVAYSQMSVCAPDGRELALIVEIGDLEQKWDAQLIASAPKLYEALSALTDWLEWSLEQSERAADEFKRDTGFLAPYKDVPADMDNFGALSAWREWYATENAKRIAAARTALASARGEG